MKTATVLLWSTAACFATALPAITIAQQTQPAPAKWGPGCNQALLNGEFSLTNAPAMPCDNEKQEFINKVIDEVRGGYGGTMVLKKSPHPYMDTPEFTAFYLRAFAEPTNPLLDTYDYRFERLMARVSQFMPMIADPRLDWDMWRAWLLLENSENTSGSYKNRYGTIAILNSARELLWNYLSYNADAILKDPKRRAWWITRLTDGLESEGGRPQRRWFLLSLLSAADTARETMERSRMPPLDQLLIVTGTVIGTDDRTPVFREALTKITYNNNLLSDGLDDAPDAPPTPAVRIVNLVDAITPRRHPQALDPFLIVTGTDDKPPPFSDALTKIAFDNDLSLTVLDLDPAAQPPTTVNSLSLAMTKWPTDKTKVINQESWSAPPSQEAKTYGYYGHEWGVRFFRTVGSRDNYSSVSFPPDRADGVYFFVYNWRLYVWPKAKMDAAIIHMLRTANLIDAAASADFEKRGFAPLKETLVKNRP